ncbi:uncharacterized protein LOC143283382 [Babylonia areolata]|uniref:uncharacterized protein LOC143283382 n=1 Tax=Babylonia areolata TaxID=304850 RepID=UPI003FCF7A76
MRSAIFIFTRQCSPKRVVVLVLAMVFMSVTYLYQRTKPPATTSHAWYTQPAPCRLPDSVLQDLVSLAFHMHGVLDSLHVQHALCYGTLWGALRQGQVLPWDTNIDFCAMDVDMAAVSHAQLKEAFLEKAILLDYDWTTGIYHARSHRGVEGRVHVFTKIYSVRDGQEMAVPGGLTRAVWRWLGERQLSFPALLLDAPFREESFHGRGMPVPHEGIELLKYLYPDDWWREVKPSGCV